MSKLLSYFNNDSMASDVWRDKYAMKDTTNKPLEQTPDDMHHRMANAFAMVEFDYIPVEDSKSLENLSPFGRELINRRNSQRLADIQAEIYDYFKGFKYIVPQGSIMSNLGNTYVFGSLSNCFGIEAPMDSYGGIMKTDQELAQLMKRRGGVGFPLSNLRPSNSFVSNAAKSSTGVVSFAERFSNTTREVAQGGRRGALMLLLHCKHPDIFNFVQMKDDKTKVTGANVSCMLTDEFMQAVVDDKSFLCTFPTKLEKPISFVGDNIKKGTTTYNLHPDFDLKYNEPHVFECANNGKITVMNIKAKELFELIEEMAWKNGEPGVAFIDRVVNYSPDGVYPQYKPELCNPCGEQWFHAYETCRLIAINLFSFVDDPFTELSSVDLEKVYEVAYMQQRLGDDLVDLEVEYVDRIINKIINDPEPAEIKNVELTLWSKVRDIAVRGRRTGNGFTGLGDMLAALNLRYGSEKAQEITDIVLKTKMTAELDATIDMAITRGEFTGWNKFEEFTVNETTLNGKNDFFEVIAKDFSEQAKRMYEYGRRNVSWSTVAPTGTVSLMTQTTSGLEPLFKAFYIRRKKINPSEAGARVDFTDQSGDTWQEYAVLHPKFKEWILVKIKEEQDATGINIYGANARPNIEGMNKEDIQKVFEQSPWYKSEANDIPYDERIAMQSIIQKYTSNALSCTINLPSDVDKSVVGELYLKAWKAGLKGVTVYRDGCRSGVLVTESHKTPVDEFGYNDAFKRPKELKAEYHYAQSNYRKYGIIVGMLNGNPYEIFAFENPLMEDKLEGTLIKEGKGVYKFVSDQYVIDNVHVVSDHKDEGLLTRWVSQMLRHGVNPKYIASQVDKSEMQIVSFARVISRTLKSYIKDGQTSEKCSECEQHTVIYSEGCKRCTSCGNSKC